MVGELVRIANKNQLSLNAQEDINTEYLGAATPIFSLYFAQ
jgi:hypothetical protein